MSEPVDESMVETGGSAGDLRRSAPGDVRREFRDAAGRLWIVSESPIPTGEWTTADDETWRAGYGVGWLTFQSGSARRRRRMYPQRWNRLSDAELERLCLFARNVSDA